MRGKEELKEITREQRYVTRPPLNEIFQPKHKKSKEQVMYDMRLAYSMAIP